MKINNKEIDPQSYAKKWFNWSVRKKERSDEEIKDSIKWLYKKEVKKYRFNSVLSISNTPKVVVCRDLSSFVKSVCNLIKNFEKADINDIYEDDFLPVLPEDDNYFFVGDLIRDKIIQEVSKTVKWSADKEIWGKIDRKIKEKRTSNTFIESSINKAIKTKLKDAIDEAEWGSTGSMAPHNIVKNALILDTNSPLYLSYFLARAEILNTAGILSDEKAENIMEYKKNSEDVCMSAFRRDKCVVLTKPEIKFNEDKKLHSKEGFALSWNEESGLHFLHGKRFNKPLWNDLVKGKATLDDLGSIQSELKKEAALKALDGNKILKEANAKLLDKSKTGSELYSAQHHIFDAVYYNYFDEEANVQERKFYFLKYKESTSGKVCLKGVPPEIGVKKDADKADAWRKNNKASS
ncbi:MAG: hypothetical protein ABEJ24_02015 [Candidatus Magasanikbacteria bacterium]